MGYQKVRTLVSVVSVGLACFAGLSHAAVSPGEDICARPFLVTDAAAVVANRRFVGGNSTEEWREEHCPNGDLVKVAEGPGHPVDPTKVVGQWSASSSDGTVVYEYTNGPRYIFTLHYDGSVYHFCGSGATVTASGLFSTPVYCGAAPP